MAKGLGKSLALLNGFAGLVLAGDLTALKAFLYLVIAFEECLTMNLWKASFEYYMDCGK